MGWWQAALKRVNLQSGGWVSGWVDLQPGGSKALHPPPSHNSKFRGLGSCHTNFLKVTPAQPTETTAAVIHALMAASSSSSSSSSSSRSSGHSQHKQWQQSYTEQQSYTVQQSYTEQQPGNPGRDPASYHQQ